MNTNIARNLVRYIALPVVSAGIIGGAALGLAGIANAGTVTYDPQPRPGIVAVPHTKAYPQVVLVPSQDWHHRHRLLQVRPFAPGDTLPN